MIGFLLGLGIAIFHSSFLFVLSKNGIIIPLFVIIIVYLFRFGLHRVGWQTAIWAGLWLDLLGNYRFGFMLLACLLVAASCDWLMPPKSGRTAGPASLWLCGVGAGLVGFAFTSAAGFAFWFSVSRGIWDALLSLILFLIVTQLTLRWRLYD